MKKGQIYKDAIVFRGKTYHFFGEIPNVEKEKRRVRAYFKGSGAKVIFRAAPDTKVWCGIFRYYPPRRK